MTSGPERYDHFIQEIAAKEQVWGLYQHGWALAGNDKGQKIFLLWPTQDAAALCAATGWNGYEPEPIALEHFLNDLIPAFQDQGILLGICPLPNQMGLTTTVKQFLQDLAQELSKY